MRRHHQDHEGDAFNRGPGWDPRTIRGRGPDVRRGGAGFGPGRPPFGPGHMQRGRARRGDMQQAILRLLDEQSMHGYQIIGELASRSGGAWNPGPGSVYPTLQAMEDQDLVQHETVGSRNVYSLTEKGRAAVVQAGQARSQSPWDEMAEASGARVDLRQAVHALIAASSQVERGASDEQMARAVALIDQARKGLYLILAE